jgi:hypothetical protein
MQLYLLLLIKYLLLGFVNYLIVNDFIHRCLKQFFFSNHYLLFLGNPNFIDFKKKHFDYLNQYRQGCYKFCELDSKALCFHSDKIITKEADFYNHSNQVQLQENQFFLFLSKIYAIN